MKKLGSFVRGENCFFSPLFFSRVALAGFPPSRRRRHGRTWALWALIDRRANVKNNGNFMVAPAREKEIEIEFRLFDAAFRKKKMNQNMLPALSLFLSFFFAFFPPRPASPSRLLFRAQEFHDGRRRRLGPAAGDKRSRQRAEARLCSCCCCCRCCRCCCCCRCCRCCSCCRCCRCCRCCCCRPSCRRRPRRRRLHCEPLVMVRAPHRRLKLAQRQRVPVAAQSRDALRRRGSRDEPVFVL